MKFDRRPVPHPKIGFFVIFVPVSQAVIGLVLHFFNPPNRRLLPSRDYQIGPRYLTLQYQRVIGLDKYF